MRIKIQGLLLFWFSFSRAKLLVDFADSTMVIMAFVRFHDLARKSRALTEDWEDVERLIATHGEDKVFLGKRPANMEDCFSRFRAIFAIPSSVPTDQYVVGVRRRRWHRCLLGEGFCPISKLIQTRLESAAEDVINLSADDLNPGWWASTKAREAQFSRDSWTTYKQSLSLKETQEEQSYASTRSFPLASSPHRS